MFHINKVANPTAEQSHDMGNYRPISLVRIPYKIFAKILYRRLSAFIESAETLDDAQSGFRPARGTTQKLAFVDAAIREANRNEIPMYLL